MSDQLRLFMTSILTARETFSFDNTQEFSKNKKVKKRQFTATIYDIAS
jgi:hypothetical protein